MVWYGYGIKGRKCTAHYSKDGLKPDHIETQVISKSDLKICSDSKEYISPTFSATSCGVCYTSDSKTTQF